MKIYQRFASRKALASFLFAFLAISFSLKSQAANPSDDLRIEVMKAYNFIVDSNVEAPSSYGPRSAYLGAKFCNDGTTAITNVTAYIGNYTNNTPGIYPARTHLALTGTFSLTHEGGRAGTRDATRYLDRIEPGECVQVYWLVSYPLKDDLGKAVWGPSVKPEDVDLWDAVDEEGFVFKARRRALGRDIVYRLRVSEDLENWQDDPVDVETLSVEQDPGGETETVRMRVNRPNAKRLYIGRKFIYEP